MGGASCEGGRDAVVLGEGGTRACLKRFLFLKLSWDKDTTIARHVGTPVLKGSSKVMLNQTNGADRGDERVRHFMGP